MLTKIYGKLKSIKNNENGFTALEILSGTVALGAIAAISIPVYTNNIEANNDDIVKNDINMAVIAVSEWKGFQRDNTTPVDISVLKTSHSLDVSEGVTLTVTGNKSAFCIRGYHEKGSEYNSSETMLTYDSLAGGLGKTGGACGTNGGTTTTTEPSPVTETVTETYQELYLNQVGITISDLLGNKTNMDIYLTRDTSGNLTVKGKVNPTITVPTPGTVNVNVNGVQYTVATDSNGNFVKTFDGKSLSTLDNTTVKYTSGTGLTLTSAVLNMVQL